MGMDIKILITRWLSCINTNIYECSEKAVLMRQIVCKGY